MNVFADLELPDAEERMIKAELALRLSHAIRARGLTQADAARALGISRDKAGQLVRGQLADFSAEQLARLLEVVGPVLIRRRRTTEKSLENPCLSMASGGAESCPRSHPSALRGPTQKGERR